MTIIRARVHMLPEHECEAAIAAAREEILAARAAYDAALDDADIPAHVWALAHNGRLPCFRTLPAWDGHADAPLVIEHVTRVEFRGRRSDEHSHGPFLGAMSADSETDIPSGAYSCRLDFGHGMHIVCIGDAFAQVCGWLRLPVDQRSHVLRLAARAISPVVLTGDDGRPTAGRYALSCPGGRLAGEVVRRSAAHGNYPNGNSWTDNLAVVFQAAA